MKTESFAPRKWLALSRLTNSAFLLPLLALVTALILGAIIIWVTSGSIGTVFDAFGGLIRGALFKERGLSDSLIATVP